MREIHSSRRRATALTVATTTAAICLLVSAAWADVSSAARPPVPTPVSELVGPHFVVHYTTTGGTTADRLTPEGAATALANAEAALAWYLSQGYPAPLNDGDGKTDIYVFAVPIGPAAGPDSSTADQTSGYILLTPAANNIYAVAHELFHVIQFGIYAHSGFFTESSAEWAGQAVVAAYGGSPPPNWFPDPQVPLDCLGPACGDASGGYRGSIFWEYLSEQFGIGIAREAFARDAVLGAADHQAHDLQALDEVLALHGSSVSAAMEGYAQAAVAGQITRPGVLPHAPEAAQLFVAGVLGEYSADTLAVDHLAMKVIAFTGATDQAAPCTPATLRLRVDLPAGVPTRPVFVTYPASGLPPATGVYPLAIAGGSAAAEIPWTTCAASTGALALPNASTSADRQAFTVHVSVAASRATQPPAGGAAKRPRLLGRRTQHVGSLSVRVLTAEAATLRGQASVTLPRVRGAVESRPMRARAAAGRAVTLRFRFAPAKLRRIRAVLAERPLRAKILVTSRNAAGATATVGRSIRLKP